MTLLALPPRRVTSCVSVGNSQRAAATEFPLVRHAGDDDVHPAATSAAQRTNAVIA